MNVYYDPTLPATHPAAWQQIEQLRDGIPLRLIRASRLLREATELLRAHGLALCLPSDPQDYLTIAEELNETANLVREELAEASPIPLQPCESELPEPA